MPTTDYKRDDRIQIIHKCLKNTSGKWSVKKLHEKVNRDLEDNGGKRVSTKTIGDDLKYLELKKFAPVISIKKGREVFYTYEEDFELYQPIIDKDQYISLILANEVLKQLKGFPLSKDLEKIARKLEHQVKDIVDINYPTILFDSSLELKNIERLQEFFECILEKTVLQVSYKPFYLSQSSVKTIHPYFLKQYNQRWFLFGYNPEYDKLDVSPIDRIVSFKPLSAEYIENTRFFPNDYFKDVIGVTKNDGQSPEKVFFKVASKRAGYIDTKPFHSSQCIVERFDTGDIVFQITAIINKELISLLLYFGSDIIVIEPKYLKELIEKELTEAINNYK